MATELTGYTLVLLASLGGFMPAEKAANGMVFATRQECLNKLKELQGNGTRGMCVENLPMERIPVR